MIYEKNEPKRTYQIIGENIKYYRQLINLNGRKMTQEDLAEKANLSIGVIGSLESKNKIQGVSILSLINLSKALGVEPSDLLTKREKTIIKDSVHN